MSWEGREEVSISQAFGGAPGRFISIFLAGKRGGGEGSNLDAHKVAHLKGEHTMEPRDLKANTFLYFTVTG